MERIHIVDVALVRVRVIFTALQGQGAHSLWYWGRGPDGTPTAQLPIDFASARQFPESILTQPLAMDAYHRAWQQIQSHAEAFAAIASARRRVRGTPLLDALTLTLSRC